MNCFGTFSTVRMCVNVQAKCFTPPLNIWIMENEIGIRIQMKETWMKRAIFLRTVIAFRWKEESGLFWKSWTQVDFNRKEEDLFHEWALERQLRSQSGDGGSLARSKWWIPGTMLRWVWKRFDQSRIRLFFRRSDIHLIAKWGCPLKMEEEQMQFHPICAGSSIRIEVPQ